jgi:RNA polymerase-binding transcription factor DksA
VRWPSSTKARTGVCDAGEKPIAPKRLQAMPNVVLFDA